MLILFPLRTLFFLLRVSLSLPIAYCLSPIHTEQRLNQQGVGTTVRHPLSLSLTLCKAQEFKKNFIDCPFKAAFPVGRVCMCVLVSVSTLANSFSEHCIIWPLGEFDGSSTQIEDCSIVFTHVNGSDRKFLFLLLVTEVQEQDLMIYCNIKLYHNRRLYLLLENNYIL